MKQKWLAVGIILLFIGMSVIPSTAQDTEKATSYSADSSKYKTNYENTKIVAYGNSPIIYVPDDFPTIQSAIDNASVGDTIIVRNGTYVEKIVIDKPLVIQSEYGYSNCTIHTNNSRGDIITIISDSVSIKGFTIVESNVFEDYEISLYNCNGSDISYCYFNSTRGDVQCSLYLESCLHCYIHNNTFIGRDNYGIKTVHSNYNIIYGNEFISHSWSGLRIQYSHYNSISYNYFHHDMIGLDIAGANNNSICFNNFSYNYRGIDADGSLNNISNNCFYKNSDAIIIFGNSNNLIFHNDFRNNGAGITFIEGGCNKVEKNNFINNTEQASFSTFFWDFSPNSWIANYWNNLHEKRPKVIVGCAIVFYLPIPYDGAFQIIIPWVNFDRNPAEEPYDIPG